MPMKYFPPTDVGPPRHGQSLSECRIGDWIYCMSVFEWSGKEGQVPYQPDAIGKNRSPVDPRTFIPGMPIWKFERRPCPDKDNPYQWPIWVRVE